MTLHCSKAYQRRTLPGHGLPPLSFETLLAMAVSPSVQQVLARQGTNLSGCLKKESANLSYLCSFGSGTIGWWIAKLLRICFHYGPPLLFSYQDRGMDMLPQKVSTCFNYVQAARNSNILASLPTSVNHTVRICNYCKRL